MYLALFALPSASVSFRQLPSASVACFLVEFASTWNHPCGRCELVTDLCTVFPRNATDAVSYASLQFQPQVLFGVSGILHRSATYTNFTPGAARVGANVNRAIFRTGGGRRRAGGGRGPGGITPM